MSAQREKIFANEKHWRKIDDGRFGNRYASVPVELPPAGLSTPDDTGTRAWGPYEIRRRPYGQSTRHYTYTIYRDGIELPLSFTGSLDRAINHVERNAAGEDTWNVA